MQTPEFLVMHIEDDDHHAELIRTAIEQSYSRWHIIRFVDAESAIDYLYGQLQSTRRAEYPLPSLVLLDLTLPGMGGLEFVGHLRSQRLTRTIPIVALSATRSQEEIEHAYQVGVSSFIVKPTRLRELAIKIAELNMYWSSTALVPPVHDSAASSETWVASLSSVCTCCRRMGTNLDYHLARTDRMVSLLVVMSESEDAAFAKAILGRNNDWFVDSASSMASALDLLKRKRYDAIVISYNLRDGCCLSLREWINDECAFIVVTPPDDSRATAQALVGGATDCVIRDALFEISLRSSVANVVKQTGDKTTKVRLRRNTSPLPVNNRLKKVLARKREEGQPVGH